MKFLSPLFVTATVLVTFAASTRAATIADPNVFNSGAIPATVTVSDAYAPAANTFPPAGIDDSQGGQGHEFFFADYVASGGSNTTTSTDIQLMSLTGFNAASGINALRFYDAETYQTSRTATQVTIYVSSSNITDPTAALVSTNYTALNGGNPFTLSTGANGFYNGGLSSDASPGFYGNYDTLTGLDIAAGTQSILFDFGPRNSSTLGSGFSEIQGFAAPEPSTYALMLAGLAVLAFGVRRKLA